MTYTPTTESVRQLYLELSETVSGSQEIAQGNAELFDRWLEAHDREIKAQALKEAADAWESGTVDFFEIKYLSDAPLGWSDESVGDAIMSSGPTMDWLRKRAQQLKEKK